MDLANKRIVLTGAASGIGASLLANLCRYGVKIIAVDVNEEALLASIRAMPSNDSVVFPFVGDLQFAETVDRIFEFALVQFSGVDVFIANAGFSYYETLNNTDWRHIETIFRVNVFSPLYSLEKMVELHDKEPYAVVMIASAMAYMAVPGYSLYSATKAAIDRFAEAYWAEIPAHARLMVVYPIAVRTQFFQKAGKQVPMFPLSQTPDFVAEKIVQGLIHNKRKVFPSALFRVMNTLSATRFLIQQLTQRIGGYQLKKWKER